jgi:hypothetical protein
MTAIADCIPKDHPVVTRIYAHHKQKGDAEPKRGYLGASIIGHSCERYLWYAFRQCCKEDIPGRIYRLLETGDLEEIRFAEELRAIGCEVHETDEAGQQFEVSAIGGHFSGHLDGCARGVPTAPKTWHVLEFKTHNAKSFAKLKAEGVIASKPTHYAQMQAYMHLTGMKRALYQAKNKDTDEIHAERVKYSKDYAEGLLAKAERIIMAQCPPARISEREDWYECSWCDAKEICWGSDSVAVPLPSTSCRQCCHATPTMDGQAHWVCEKHGRGLGPADQDRACRDHLLLPGLVTFAEPTEYNEDPGYIEFTNRDGKKWRHGKHQNGDFCTYELMSIPVLAIGNPTIETAKELFRAEATDHITRYTIDSLSDDVCQVVWRGTVRQLASVWKDTYGIALDDEEVIDTIDTFEYRAVIFNNGRAALTWYEGPSEIREGIK